MSTAEEWNLEYSWICASDPAVHGQLLPTPQNVEFLKRVQVDASKPLLDKVEKLRELLGEWIDSTDLIRPHDKTFQDCGCDYCEQWKNQQRLEIKTKQVLEETKQ